MMDSENEDYSGGENVTGLIWAVIVLFVDTPKFKIFFFFSFIYINYITIITISTIE